MDELIVLLIKGIIRLFSGPAPTARQRVPTVATPTSPAGRQPQPRRQPPVAAARPRGGRPSSIRAAVASPILTGSRPVAAAVPPPAPAPAAAARAKVATATKPPTAATVTVRKWLTPKALRQQVVVSEILRPPLALRDDR